MGCWGEGARGRRGPRGGAQREHADRWLGCEAMAMAGRRRIEGRTKTSSSESERSKSKSSESLSDMVEELEPLSVCGSVCVKYSNKFIKHELREFDEKTSSLDLK